MIRLLFVDDQQRELDGMTRMMNWAELGIEIAGAVTDARDALAIADREPIDIVVTDVIMQNMDGLTLVREFKQRHPHIKTVCISGFDDFKFVSMALNNGAVGYLLKPILVNEMRPVMERLAAERRAERMRAQIGFDAGRLAMICMGATNWQDGLEDEELNRMVRCARGRSASVSDALTKLELEDGSCVCVLDADAPVVKGMRVSESMPLRRIREGYLQTIQESERPSARSSDADVVERIKQNIEAHLCEDIAVERLLEDIYLSSSYANGLFKESTGMTIHRYVVQRRLELAAEMLLDEPGMRVKDVAWRCGFSDASHLINSFQRAYKMTPEKYRRRHAQSET